MMASYPESLVMFRAEQEKRRVRLRSGTAFAFDINGVLLHSDAALPGATEILRHLRDIGVLFLFLTNSGGAHERHRIERLSQQLPFLFQRINSSNLIRQSKLWSRCIEIKASWSLEVWVTLAERLRKCMAFSLSSQVLTS
jgi:hypothetical protein